LGKELPVDRLQGRKGPRDGWPTRYFSLAIHGHKLGILPLYALTIRWKISIASFATDQWSFAHHCIAG